MLGRPGGQWWSGSVSISLRLLERTVFYPCSPGGLSQVTDCAPLSAQLVDCDLDDPHMWQVVSTLHERLALCFES